MNNKNIAPEKKREKRRANSADVMIVLLFVLAVAGMVLRFGFLERIEQRAVSTEATVSVLIEGISKSSADLIKEGDMLRFSDSGEEIGVISTPVIESSELIFYTDNGEIMVVPSVVEIDNAEADDKVNVRLQITVKGEMTESGFMLNSKVYIAPNKTLYAETDALATSMTVVNISVVEQ